MENKIEVRLAHEKSNIELLLNRMRAGNLDAKLGREEACGLCNSIESAALLDADNIRKEAGVAVIKLSAALETTTRLLADAQERLEEADQVIAQLSRKPPEA